MEAHLNVLSFSLYGDALKYRVGMLRNLKLAEALYPSWNVQIYCDYECGRWLGKQKITHPAMRVDCMPENHWCPSMLWRFLIADNPECQRFCSRDCDSRIMQREVDAVNAWMLEDTILHCLRDHGAHCQPVMGGLFGLMPRRSNWEMPNMERLIREYLSEPCPYRAGTYMHDQSFLWAKIWPWAKASCTQHASVCRQAYPGSKPFPSKRDPFPRFVGEVYEVDENWNEFPREGDYQQIGKEE